MFKVSLNEMAALLFVLSNINVKDLLHCAMLGLSQDNTTIAQDKANVCSQAINTFLN